MNSKVKNILIFAAGATIGVLAGYIVAKRKCDEFYREELEDVTNTLRETLRKKKEKIIEDAESIDEMSAVVEIPVKKKKTNRQNYKNLTRIYASGNPEPVAEINESEEEYKYRNLSNKDDNEPHVITIEQFSEECDQYDKSTIYYYEDDDVLADENEEVIIDVDSIVGGEALTSFGEGSEDSEVVYVRNDRLQIDYEIIRLSKSYKETVLGFTDEERGGNR